MKQISKFLLGFLIISLFVTICYIPEVKATSSFGKTSKGESYALATENFLRGSNYSCPESGTATSITAYFKQSSSATPNIKMAIYRDSDSALVGYTEEWLLTTGWDDWKTLSLVWGGTLSAETYVLVFWTDDSVNYYHDAAATYHFDSEPYNGFPNPASFTESGTKDISIYCTYTPTAAGEYSEEFTETVSISASLYLWQALFHKYTETITITASLYSWREKTSFYTETTTVTDQSNKWIELARFFTETITATETSTFSMEILIVITEFVETITVDASLYLWRAIQHDFYETVTLTASLQALAEEFISFVEFPELIEFDADLYLTLPIIPPPEVELTTFGTVAFIIAIIALAIGVVALRRRE